PQVLADPANRDGILVIETHQETAERAALDLHHRARSWRAVARRDALCEQPFGAVFEGEGVDPGFARTDRGDSRADFLQLAGRRGEAFACPHRFRTEALRAAGRNRRSAALRAGSAPRHRHTWGAAEIADIVVVTGQPCGRVVDL